MEGLLSLLFFAGLFYVMMRFGCGSHMVHGHHDGHKDSATDDSKHVDPVCGKNVAATEGYGMMHEGNLYRFCSRQCLDAFEAHPDRHLANQEATTS